LKGSDHKFNLRDEISYESLFGEKQMSLKRSILILNHLKIGFLLPVADPSLVAMVH
jgi:hypothetical protein